MIVNCDGLGCPLECILLSTKICIHLAGAADEAGTCPVGARTGRTRARAEGKGGGARERAASCAPASPKRFAARACQREIYT